MQLEVLPAISAIEASAWDALVDPDDPFATHAFLHALEQSGSAAEETGWMPCHLALRDEGRLVGAMPLYLKGHSYGEYIFDWGWADAAMRAGLRYYPKLVSAVPFTPVTGRRLLLGGPVEPGDWRVGGLVEGLEHLLRETGASGWHVLFCTEPEQAALRPAMARLTFQFHWHNQGYRDFEDWLGHFRSRARKEARRERRLPPGLEIVEIEGEALSDREIDAIYRFYRDTVDRKGGHDYLTEGFFRGLSAGPLRDQVVVFAALQHGRVVASALTFQRGGGLYGRYWGCEPGFHGLHFELCYHRPIERCIRLGLRRFEAGAQGGHKLKRGLMPALTYSSHRLVHPGLRRAVAEAVEREARLTKAHVLALARHGPFRRGGDEAEPGEAPMGPEASEG